MVDIPFLSALEADVVAYLDRAIGLNVQPGKKITERILKSDSDGQTSYTKSCDEGSQRDAQIIKKNIPPTAINIILVTVSMATPILRIGS
jgi:hypothetical protein